MVSIQRRILDRLFRQMLKKSPGAIFRASPERVRRRDVPNKYVPGCFRRPASRNTRTTLYNVGLASAFMQKTVQKQATQNPKCFYPKLNSHEMLL